MVVSEILPLRPALAALRGDWQRLYRSGAFEPCVSFEWSSALVENQLATHPDLWVVLLKRDDRAIGMVPLMRDTHAFAGLSVYLLRPIAERYATHSDLLIAEHDDEAIDALFRALLAMPQRWEEFRVGRLVDSARLRAVLGSVLGCGGYAHSFRHEPPSYFLELPAEFASYLSARDGKFRNFLKRMEKRLKERGELQFHVCAAEADVDSTFGALLEIESKSWKHGHGTSIARIRHQRGFYHDLCRSTAALGTLHLSVLSLDKRPVAHNLGLVEGGRYYYLKTSYVAELKELAPASIARAWLIRSLIEGGIREFDFPAEPYAWERQWSSQLRHHEGLSVFNRTRRARMLAVAHALKNRLFPREKDAWTYADPKSHHGPPEQ